MNEHCVQDLTYRVVGLLVARVVYKFLDLVPNPKGLFWSRATFLRRERWARDPSMALVLWH